MVIESFMIKDVSLLNEIITEERLVVGGSYLKKK